MGETKGKKEFSVAIYKNQLPADCKHINVVMALIDQYNEEAIDCVQPLTGLYKIDVLNKEIQKNLLTKHLKLLGRTIPVTQWLDGMDCPKTRLSIRGLHKDHPNEPILEAIKNLDYNQHLQLKMTDGKTLIQVYTWMWDQGTR